MQNNHFLAAITVLLGGDFLLKKTTEGELDNFSPHDKTTGGLA